MALADQRGGLLDKCSDTGSQLIRVEIGDADKAGVAGICIGYGVAGLPMAVIDTQYIVGSQTAVVMVEDDVVNVDETLNIHRNSGFFRDLSSSSINGGFARFDVAAGQAPDARHATLAAFDDKDLSVAEDGGTCSSFWPMFCYDRCW